MSRIVKTYGTILSPLVALGLVAGPPMAAPLSVGDILDSRGHRSPASKITVAPRNCA